MQPTELRQEIAAVFGEIVAAKRLARAGRAIELDGLDKRIGRAMRGGRPASAEKAATCCPCSRTCASRSTSSANALKAATSGGPRPSAALAWTWISVLRFVFALGVVLALIAVTGLGRRGATWAHAAAQARRQAPPPRRGRDAAGRRPHARFCSSAATRPSISSCSGTGSAVVVESQHPRRAGFRAGGRNSRHAGPGKQVMTRILAGLALGAPPCSRRRPPPRRRA